jgi:hypothetical protein
MLMKLGVAMVVETPFYVTLDADVLLTRYTTAHCSLNVHSMFTECSLNVH